MLRRHTRAHTAHHHQVRASYLCFWCVSVVLLSVFFRAGVLFWCWCGHAAGVYTSAVLVIVCFCADACMLHIHTRTRVRFLFARCVCTHSPDLPLTHSLTCVMCDFFLRGVWCAVWCVACTCVCLWCVACACVCIWFVACACVCLWCVACACVCCVARVMIHTCVCVWCVACASNTHSCAISFCAVYGA